MVVKWKNLLAQPWLMSIRSKDSAIWLAVAPPYASTPLISLLDGSILTFLSLYLPPHLSQVWWLWSPCHWGAWQENCSSMQYCWVHRHSLDHVPAAKVVADWIDCPPVSGVCPIPKLLGARFAEADFLSPTASIFTLIGMPKCPQPAFQHLKNTPLTICFLATWQNSWNLLLSVRCGTAFKSHQLYVFSSSPSTLMACIMLAIFNDVFLCQMTKVVA